MRRVLFAVAGTGCLFAAAQAQAPLTTLQDAMKNVVAPQAQVLWDVSNLAMDDEGKADPKRLSAAQWAQIGAAGQKVKDMSLALAMARHVAVVAPAGKIQSEGEPNASTAAQVQGFIDADPETFAEHARRLGATAGDFVAAAKSRDGAKLGDASGALDQVCEDCHMKYWYPQESAGAATGG